MKTIKATALALVFSHTGFVDNLQAMNNAKIVFRWIKTNDITPQHPLRLYDAIRDDDYKLIKTLLELEWRVNSKDNVRYPPLIMAIIWNNIRIVRLLLHYNANPNLVDHGSDSPLIWTALLNRAHLTHLLLKHGGDWTYKSKGLTAYAVAQNFGSLSVQNCLQPFENFNNSTKKHCFIFNRQYAITTQSILFYWLFQKAFDQTNNRINYRNPDLKTIYKIYRKSLKQKNKDIFKRIAKNADKKLMDEVKRLYNLYHFSSHDCTFNYLQ